MKTVYDAGALVAADRNDRSVWAAHRIRLELGVRPVVPAPVVAQVSRTDRQAQLRRFLRGCEVVPFRSDQAHLVGSVLAAAGMSDVVDAHVVVTGTGGEIVTSDTVDITRLAAHVETPIRITAI